MLSVVRRKYLGGGVAALGGLLAAACGEPTVRYVGQPQAGPAGPAGPQGPKGAAGAQGVAGAQGAVGAAAKVPVNVEDWIGLPRTHPSGEANHAAVERAAEELLDTYNIVVSVLSVAGVTQKTVVAAAGGQPPTNAHIAFWDGAVLYAPGLAVSPDDQLKHVKEWAAHREDIFPGMLNTVLWRGKLTSLPTDTNNRGIYFDKGVLQKAGVAEPTPNWSFKEFEEKIDKASSPPDYWGFTYRSGSLDFLIFYGGWGGELMNSDQTKWTVDNDVALTTMQWLYDLSWKHQIVPSPPPGEMMRTGEGKVAFDITGNFRHPTLVKVGVDSGAAPMPRHNVPYTMAHGWVNSILKVPDDAVQEGAALYAMWKSGPGWGVPFCLEGSNVPISGATLNHPTLQAGLKEDPILKTFIDQAPYAWRVPTFPSGRKSESELSAFVKKGLDNELGLKEALEQGQRAAQIVLDNDIKQYG